jgi:diguanylate cyclase (GGDEF)-like protein
VREAGLGGADHATAASTVDDGLLDELYQRSVPSLMLLAFTLAFLRAIERNLKPESPWADLVFSALFAVIALRLALSLPARARRGPFASARFRRAVFAVGSGLVGLGLAGVNVVTFVPHHSYDGILTICQTGINSIALLSLGGSPSIYLLFMFPNLASLVLLGLRADDHVLPPLLLVYAAALWVMARHEYKTRRDNLVLRAQLAEMVTTDALTELRNRRYLADFMDREAARLLRTHVRARAGGSPGGRLCLMLLDVDNFKSVNDARGHDAGDVVLKQVAHRIAGGLRKPDLVVRWGGEEFVIVAREIDGERALPLAERLRQLLAEHPFVLPGGASIRITCSIGFAVFPFCIAADTDGLGSWQQVLALADVALLEAKRGGRDRVLGIAPGASLADATIERLEEIKRDLTSAQERGLVRLHQSA